MKTAQMISSAFHINISIFYQAISKTALCVTSTLFVYYAVISLHIFFNPFSLQAFLFALVPPY